MGLFTKKKKKEAKKPLPFLLLENLEQLEEIEQASKDKLIAIFKHSTRCGTSRMSFNMFQSNYDRSLENVQVYVLDLLAHRDVSDAVAEKFQVFHQSPQLILIKDAKAVYHASHYQITPEVLVDYIDC